MMTKLSVNVNKIATIRNTRETSVPSIVHLSRIALDAGADGITVHPRPDERHIRPHDVDDIAVLLKEYPEAEYNIEGNPFHGLLEHCRRVRPHQATLVPDAHEAVTSNHGWDLVNITPADRAALVAVIEELRGLGCRVSLFVDPVPQIMTLAKQLNADRVELYTEPYAQACARGQAAAGVVPYIKAADAARTCGLGVNAGHDLNLQNLPGFLKQVVKVDEVSIGHALIADALEMGMRETVQAYLRICRG